MVLKEDEIAIIDFLDAIVGLYLRSRVAVKGRLHCLAKGWQWFG